MEPAQEDPGEISHANFLRINWMSRWPENLPC